jgi:spore coat polysaccharide biosynthesis protein SpsF
MTQAKFKTEQESFWAGEFGADYIRRNDSKELLASNLAFFSKALKSAAQINSCIEFGANIGMNLRALKLLFPNMQQFGIEINPEAAQGLEKVVGNGNVFMGSIFDYEASGTFDVALIKGVLIHIKPEMLEHVYRKLYASTHRHILVCEYYNPSPVTIPYRGHTDRLFKRDFCGEMMEFFPDLKLIDYGFAYRRDPAFPQDDITWFLMKKEA